MCCGGRMDGLKGWVTGTVAVGFFDGYGGRGCLRRVVRLRQRRRVRRRVSLLRRTVAPLQMRSLGQVSQTDPFPAINPKNFTADSPVASRLWTAICA